MLTGQYPRRLLFANAAVLALLAGCAQPGPILSRRTTVGSLKTSLSHIEFENQQLRSRVVNLESENREIEDRLVEEERVNGDLSARLDNARNLLSDRGYDWQDSPASASRWPRPGEESPAPSRTLPAGRSNRTPRKPPFARIPGRGSSSAPPAAAERDDEFSYPTIPSAESFGPQSWQQDDAQWLPIARGTGAGAGAGSSKVR
jgi:hypothetical protein